MPQPDEPPRVPLSLGESWTINGYLGDEPGRTLLLGSTPATRRMRFAQRPTWRARWLGRPWRPWVSAQVEEREVRITDSDVADNQFTVYMEQTDLPRRSWDTYAWWWPPRWFGRTR